MPTFNKVDMLNCAAGHHDFSDDADECHVCGYREPEASVPADPVRNAAPDMLAALRKIQDRIEGKWHDPAGDLESDIAGVVRAAIAKVDGKEPPAPVPAKPSRVVVTVSGGVADISDSENWPDGLEVFMVDYDNEGETVDGDHCSLAKIEKGDAARHDGHLAGAAAKAWSTY